MTFILCLMYLLKDFETYFENIEKFNKVFQRIDD